MCRLLPLVGNELLINGNPLHSSFLVWANEISWNKETLKTSATSLQRKSGKRSFDKVTVWDSGNGAATANFLSGLIKSLPPLHEIAKMAGLELPTYLGEMKPGDEKSPKGSPE
jgi:hypothetical protein